MWQLQRGILNNRPAHAPQPAAAGFVLDGHTVHGALNTHTTSAINTATNSDSLIVVGQTAYSNDQVSGTLTDSPSNTWSNLTARGAGGGLQPLSRISYKYAPTTNASHTATSTGSIMAEALFLLGFTGAQVSSTPFDQENGGTGTGTSKQIGSVTPTTNGQLLLALIGWDAAISSLAIDSGFTIIDQIAYSAGVNYGGAMAYLVQNTAAAINPTWSWTSTATVSVAIATFKAA